MRKVFTGLLAASFAGAMLMACGGDDSNGASPGDDAGNDGSTINPVDGSTPGTDGSKPPVADGGDAGGVCNFATFVKGLVANDTTMTALPSTDLGQSCTDNQNQAEFQSLFP
jgi:hypothetical protein